MKHCRLDGVAGRYGSILIDPPWRFQNRTGKIAPEHGQLHRYETPPSPSRYLPRSAKANSNQPDRESA